MMRMGSHSITNRALQLPLDYTKTFCKALSNSGRGLHSHKGKTLDYCEKWTHSRKKEVLKVIFEPAFPHHHMCTAGKYDLSMKRNAVKLQRLQPGAPHSFAWDHERVVNERQQSFNHWCNDKLAGDGMATEGFVTFQTFLRQKCELLL